VKVSMRFFVGLAVGSAIMMAFLVPVTLAQKPPAPAPPPVQPPVGTPGPTTVPTLPNSQPDPFRGDLVMFLAGNVKTDDGTPLPDNVKVERVCSARVRQQVYASLRGDFTMELGSTAESFMDATGEGDVRDGLQNPQNQNKMTESGVPRRSLMNCEMRAEAAGFRSDTVSLVQLTPSGSWAEIGSIVVHRIEKIKGMTLNAAPYKAPRDARSAYEKGLNALRHDKLADAQQHFEEAVKIYSRYATAWFELGDVLRKESHNDAARTAYLRATAIDSRFLPPYLSLASMAFDEQDWKEVLGLTRHILAHDSMDYGGVAGYVLDLDSLDYAQAYFYNSAANFRLNRIEEAEKSGLRAERLDVRPRYPQLRLLLAEIFLQKNNYEGAIDQLQMYLEIMPNGANADLAREKLTKLKNPDLVSKQTDQN
jgi:hypothetical protein